MEMHMVWGGLQPMRIQEETEDQASEKGRKDLNWRTEAIKNKNVEDLPATIIKEDEIN